MATRLALYYYSNALSIVETNTLAEHIAAMTVTLYAAVPFLIVDFIITLLLLIVTTYSWVRFALKPRKDTTSLSVCLITAMTCVIVYGIWWY